MDTQIPSLQNQAIERSATGLLPLPADDDALIRARDAPLYLGIAAQTLARWRHEGVGARYTKLGRLCFYRAGDLREWIRSRVRQHTIDAA